MVINDQNGGSKIIKILAKNDPLKIVPKWVKN
jgi:hypothetical protein